MATLNIQIPEDLKDKMEQSKKLSGLSLTALTIIALETITKTYLNEKQGN